MALEGLHPPAYLHVPPYDVTLGPEVAQVCELAGFPPDEDQKRILDVNFAYRAGRVAAMSSVIITPRQNIKTSTFEMTTIGWLVLLKDWIARGERPPLFIWSAHEYSTALDTHRHLAEIFEGSDFLRRRVKSIPRSNGEEGIEMLDGSRLKFRARTKTGGRGLAGARTVLDEAFALQDSHMGALVPIMSARRDAQLLYGSSAGHENSFVLRDLRDRGREGDDAIFYLETCDDLPGDCQVPQCDHARSRPGCRLDDERRWERANPALDRRVSREYIRLVERATMPPAEFARERLGWWDEDPRGGGVFDMGKWATLADPESELTDLCCFSIDATPERTTGSISIAAARTDGKPYLETIDQRSGVDWMVTRAAELEEFYQPIGFVVDPASAAGALITDLEMAGVTVIRPKTREVMYACGMMFDGIEAGWLRQSGQPELARALEGAVKRPYADGWLLDRRHPNVDCTPLISGVLALWGLNSQLDGGGLGPDEVAIIRT